MTQSIFSFMGGAALALVAGVAQPMPGAPPAPVPDAPGVLAALQPETAAAGPNLNNSYQVMCQKDGLNFSLRGGLLYLDPDTLQVTSVGKTYEATLPGPVGGADIPDRYEAAHCSEDGGRTWGKVLLDFYVPNFGESSVTHTGLESSLLGGQSSAEHAEFPAGDEADLYAFVAALRRVLGEPPEAGVATPALPPLPAPFYTIELKYRGPLGQYVSTSAPGVVGIPSMVSLVNYYGGAPETLAVQIGPSQTASGDGTVSSSGYALTVQRTTLASLTSPCVPLDADVKVVLHLANPANPLGTSGTVELGYQTISTAASGHAPSSFGIKYESAPAGSDFFVDVTQVPSCNDAGPLNVVGRFADQGTAGKADDDVDLTVALKMPRMTRWNLARRTDANSRMRILSTAGAPIGELSVAGVDRGRTLDASLSPLPEKLTVCAHRGNQCNEPWRLDRVSEASFYVMARDQNDKPSPATARYAEAGSGGSTGLELTLSDLAYDFYVGQIGWRELPVPFVHGDYPKWFHLDTLGSALSGYYRSQAGPHHFGLDIPGHNSVAWNREVVVDKKNYGTRIDVDFWGEMVCSRGFNIDMDVGGRIAGSILGQSFCHGFAP